MAFLEADEMDIPFERALEHDFALLAGHRHHILETAQPEAAGCAGSGGRFGCGCGCDVASAMLPEDRAPVGATARSARPACGRTGAVLQGAQGLVRRRQIGRVGEAHQHHFGRRNRSVRGLNLRDALEQDLPGARQGAHRQRLREFKSADALGFRQYRILRGVGNELEAGDDMREGREIGQDHAPDRRRHRIAREARRKPPARRRA